MSFVKNNTKTVLAVALTALACGGAFAAISIAGPSDPTPPRVAPTYVTSLPSSPTDGQEVYYKADEGVIWHFRYRATGNSWEFVGGPPLMATENTERSFSNTSPNETIKWAPITAPLSGTYRVVLSARSRSNNQNWVDLSVRASSSQNWVGLLAQYGGSATPAGEGVQPQGYGVEESALQGGTTYSTYGWCNGGTCYASRVRVQLIPVKVNP